MMKMKMSAGIKSKARLLWAKVTAASVPVREFLETSTLHGLVYISKAETVWGKVLWAVSVIVSFSLAGVLINESFTDWSHHPISSVISTHPIKDLKFPNVTVCPPKGTNTALNYDLFKLNGSFTLFQKDLINKHVNDTFMEKETDIYVNTLSDLVNRENLKNIYQGFHAIPTHLGKRGYTSRVTGQKGQIVAKSSETYDNVNYILELPANLGQLLGENGSLVIEIVLDPEIGTLEYLEGSKYVTPILDGIGRSWYEASDQCNSLGGKLPSIHTKEDNDELRLALDNKRPWAFWIGGKNDGNWTWTDGSEWGYQNWHYYYEYDTYEPNGEGTQCLFFYDDLMALRSWYDGYCDYKDQMSFACELEPHQIIGIKETIIFKKDSLPKGSIHFWWKSLGNKSNETTPFISKEAVSIRWKIEHKYPNLELISRNLVGRVNTPDLGEEVETEFYSGDRSNTFILELPDKFEDIVGKGRFVVNLNVNTRFGEGWREDVQYSDGNVFKYHPERKTWEEAEKYCSKHGTHLASVISWRELRKLTAIGEKQLWTGGIFDGNWTWTDGEAWDEIYWDAGYPKKESSNNRLVLYMSGYLRNYGPKARFPFVCKTMMKMTGIQNRTWKYTADDLKNTQKITVQWKYQFPGEEVLAKWTKPRRTGFNITWYVQNEEGHQKDTITASEELWTSKLDTVAAYTAENVFFAAFVNLAQQALEENIPHNSMLVHLKNIIAQQKTFFCKLGQAEPDLFRSFFCRASGFSFNLLTDFNLTFDTKIYKNISTIALHNGFELYVTLLHCPSHKEIDLFLRDFFLNFTSPRDLLQGASNIINSGSLRNQVNIDHPYEFCKEMQSMFGLYLPDILQNSLLSEDIDILKRSRYPFLEQSQNFAKDKESTYNPRDSDTESLKAELSSHPVHLKTRNGTILPSAFIPFCAYKTDLLMLGERITGLKFPVCNKFKPTVLDGQLCYTLDLSSTLPNTMTLDGKEGELTLLLDYNNERSIGLQKTKNIDNESSDRYLNMKDTFASDDHEARIFIHTLKPYSGHGAGSYTMSSLKQMSPTEDFLKLLTEKRGCAYNDEQDCLMKNFLKQKLYKCGCTPWEFLNWRKDVRKFLIIHEDVNCKS